MVIAEIGMDGSGWKRAQQRKAVGAATAFAEALYPKMVVITHGSSIERWRRFDSYT